MVSHTSFSIHDQDAPNFTARTRCKKSFRRAHSHFTLTRYQFLKDLEDIGRRSIEIGGP